MASRKHPGSKSVGWALVQAARLHRARMGDKLGSLGLFAGQEGVLQTLADGPMTMGELAGLLRVRPPTASKTVSRLSALGLVERRSEPGDARLVRVGLTSAGEAKAKAIDGLWEGPQALAQAPAQGRPQPRPGRRRRFPRPRGRARGGRRGPRRSAAGADGGDRAGLKVERSAHPVLTLVLRRPP